MSEDVSVAFEARFDGRCAWCGLAIYAGERMRFATLNGEERRTYCDDCGRGIVEGLIE